MLPTDDELGCKPLSPQRGSLPTFEASTPPYFPEVINLPPSPDEDPQITTFSFDGDGGFLPTSQNSLFTFSSPLLCSTRSAGTRK